MRQSTLSGDCGGTVGAAHCAFRAVGGAIALLHDDGRGLGIAHGRDMSEVSERGEGGSLGGLSAVAVYSGGGIQVAFIRLE